LFTWNSKHKSKFGIHTSSSKALPLIGLLIVVLLLAFTIISSCVNTPIGGGESEGERGRKRKDIFTRKQRMKRFL
jgi:hypothetical protein